MRCSAFRDRLVAFADGELPEHLAQRMAEHAVSCRECAAELAAVRQEGALYTAAFWRHKAPGDLAAKVAAAIADREPAGRGVRGFFRRDIPVQWVWATGAVGALLLVCMGVVAIGRDSLMAKRAAPAAAGPSVMWAGGLGAPKLEGAAGHAEGVWDDGSPVERRAESRRAASPVLPASYAAPVIQQAEPSVELEEMGPPGAATASDLKTLNDRVVRPNPLTPGEQMRLNAAASGAPHAVASGAPGMAGGGPPSYSLMERQRAQPSQYPPSAAGWGDREADEARVPSRQALPPVNIDSTEATVTLTVGYRQAEGQYVTTYTAAFEARYAVRAPDVERKGVRIAVAFPFPSGCSTVSGPKLLVNNEEDEDRTSYSIAGIRWVGWFKPKETKSISIAYTARGEGSYRYALDKNRLSKRFRFVVTVNGLEPGRQVEIPSESLQPDPQSKRTARGWQYVWDHDGLLTTKDIIINFPAKESPSALAERVGENAQRLLPIARFAPLFLVLYLGALFVTGLPRQDRRYLIETFVLLGLVFLAFYPLFIFVACYVGPGVALCTSLALVVALSSVYASVTGGRSVAARVAAFQVVLLGAFTYGLLEPAITGLMITLGVVALVAVFMLASVRRARLVS